MPTATDTTDLLVALRRGEPGALDDLMPRVYAELHRLARRELARRGRHPTLETAGLVHEAYLKLVDQTRVDVADRAHFLAVTGRAMRQVVVDRARRRQAKKRGGHWRRVPLDDAPAVPPEQVAELVALDEALTRLERLDPRLGQVVECRYFAGMSIQETAQALGLAPRTVDRAWQKARAWLHHEIDASE
ncbi:MAG TPA: ECF-type sigma factor [Longimicrobiales bacterium]|nr:ECF-type sigma factor [Longimicrobiales bacterium]